MTVTPGVDAWPLVAVSALCSVMIVLVFRYASDQQAIRQTKKRIHAHLIELWLFADEPSVIWRAQASLLKANLQLMKLLIGPALLIGLPMAVLAVQLDAVYGRAPLPISRASVLTVQISGLRIEPYAGQYQPEQPALEPNSAIADDTPSVKIPAENRIAWRICPVRAFSGALRIRFGEVVVEKSVAAGPGPRYKSERRVRNLLSFLAHPTERRLAEGPVSWIEVQYPPAEIAWFGLQFHWLLWFALFTTVGAFALQMSFRSAA